MVHHSRKRKHHHHHIHKRPKYAAEGHHHRHHAHKRSTKQRAIARYKTSVKHSTLNGKGLGDLIGLFL